MEFLQGQDINSIEVLVSLVIGEYIRRRDSNANPKQSTVQPIAKPAIQTIAKPAIQTIAKPAIQTIAEPAIAKTSSTNRTNTNASTSAEAALTPSGHNDHVHCNGKTWFKLPFEKTLLWATWIPDNVFPQGSTIHMNITTQLNFLIYPSNGRVKQGIPHPMTTRPLDTFLKESREVFQQILRIDLNAKKKVDTEWVKYLFPCKQELKSIDEAWEVLFLAAHKAIWMQTLNRIQLLLRKNFCNKVFTESDLKTVSKFILLWSDGGEFGDVTYSRNKFANFKRDFEPFREALDEFMRTWLAAQSKYEQGKGNVYFVYYTQLKQKKLVKPLIDRRLAVEYEDRKNVPFCLTHKEQVEKAKENDVVIFLGDALIGGAEDLKRHLQE